MIIRNRIRKLREGVYQAVDEVVYIDEGQQIRKGWGVAWYDVARARVITAPIPLNKLLGLGRRAYWHLVAGVKPHRLDVEWQARMRAEIRNRELRDEVKRLKVLLRYAGWREDRTDGVVEGVLGAFDFGEEAPEAPHSGVVERWSWEDIRRLRAEAMAGPAPTASYQQRPADVPLDPDATDEEGETCL